MTPKKRKWQQKNYHPLYKIGDYVSFLNKNGQWVDGHIVGFDVKAYHYQAIIKCDNPQCEGHKICVHSKNLVSLMVI